MNVFRNILFIYTAKQKTHTFLGKRPLSQKSRYVFYEQNYFPTVPFIVTDEHCHIT